MKITEIRVKLVDGDPTRQRLRAFCSLTFDNAFVVRDLKVLEGNQGYFVAMPSRKMTFRCPNCRQRNAIGSNYCSQCGVSLAGFDPCANMTDVSISFIRSIRRLATLFTALLSTPTSRKKSSRRGPATSRTTIIFSRSRRGRRRDGFPVLCGASTCTAVCARQTANLTPGK